MNENARALYEDLKASRLPQFCMANVTTCGTPQCILGHALHRMGLLGQWISHSDYMVLLNNRKETKMAYRWLGLKPSIGFDLCFPGCHEKGDVPTGRERRVWGSAGTASDVNQPEAAEALKRACELSEGAQ